MRILFFILCSLVSEAQVINVIATLNRGQGSTEIPFVIVDNATKGNQGYQTSYNIVDNAAHWWLFSGAEAWYANTGAFSNTLDDQIEMTFNGTKVYWYTETAPHLGIADIYIDDVLASNDVDLYAAAPGTQQVLKFTSSTLTQAVHTIKIVVTHTKNASSTGYYVNHDYFKVENPGDVPETPDPEPYDRFWGVGGTDAGTCSTLGTQCASLRYTLTQAIAGDKVKGGAGTFTESGGYIVVPDQVSIWGAGIDATTIKLNAALNYTSAFDVTKAMFQYSGGTGTQTLKDLSIEGNAKLVNGGIYVNRNNVDFDNIRISNFDRFGFYATGNGIDLTNSEINNAAFSSVGGFSTGAILVGACDDFTVDNVDIAEGEGYGVKAWESQPVITRFQFKNSSITVPPGSNCCSNVNIAFELHDCYPRDCLISNSYFDGNVSLVKPQGFADDSNFSIWLTNSTFDIKTRGNINTTGVELTMHNVEIDHCYFRGFKHSAIMNFDDSAPSRNWEFHENVFYAETLTNTNPTGIFRADAGFYNVDIFNNTIDIPPGTSATQAQNQTVAVLFQGASGVGGTSTDVQFKNNIVFDQSTADGAAGANHMWRIEGSGGTITGSSTFQTNIINGMPVGSVSGVTYTGNLTGAPGLNASGRNPTPTVIDPWYRPVGGSIAIEAGTNVGLPFTGSAPTIGRFEEN